MLNKASAQSHSGFVMLCMCICMKHIELSFCAEPPGFTVHARMKKADQILCAEPFQPRKTCTNNKLCMEPFLLRYTCSYEYVLTLGTHPNSTSTFEHVQKT